MRKQNIERLYTQCSVFENGIRCSYTVYYIEKELCRKHYTRFQRNGSVFTKRVRGKKALKNHESSICLCGHKFNEHNAHSKCVKFECCCKKFDSVNAIVFLTTIGHMKKLGFASHINNKSVCLHCGQEITVGYWHDVNTIRRMRNHLKIHQRRIGDINRIITLPKLAV